MDTIIRRKAQLSVVAVAALAIFAVAAVMLLAGGFTTGTAQAQPDPNLNTGKYTDPQPCGIFVSKVSDNPDGEFNNGHVALFDAYWDYNTQTLNNNLCPPLAEHTVVTDRKGTRILTGRTASNIDVNKTVFHADDKFKHTITAEEKAKYHFLPQAGTEVWWLKQDDPVAEAREAADRKAKGLPPAPEEPELVLGLSAGLFDKADWYAEKCNLEKECTEVKPLEYEFEAERDPEGNVIPFLVFENDAENPIWDSRNADTNSIELDPGEYRHYNWVFFPGADQSHTYVLEVHMKGHVRTKANPGITPDNWKPLTWPKNTPYNPGNDIVMDEIAKVVTSELVKQEYTIHVGPLHLNEQSRFGAYGVAFEGAAPGTQVGHHISLFGTDRDGLVHTLEGDGSEDFSVAEQEYGSWLSAKIVVAEGANLVYAERPYYDLLLTVSDAHDHTDGSDTAIDDTIPVRIQVFPDGSPYAVLRFNNEYPRIGEAAYIEASVNALPSGSVVTGFTLREETVTVKNGKPVTEWETVVPQRTGPDWARFSFAREKPGTRSYEVVVSYQVNGGGTETVKSALYPLTWRR